VAAPRPKRGDARKREAHRAGPLVGRAGPGVGLPVVAIVGRPNVGKSTLFNRVVGARTAIVEDRARTTRDRLYGDAEWNGRRFVIVDTGGLEVDPDDPIEAKVQEQARLAIAEADAIVLVVDAAAGLTPADQEAADLLRVARVPVLVAANKADNERRELDAAEFHRFGWLEMHPISAAHGRGVADFLDALIGALPPESAEEIARKAREIEAEAFARDVASGHLQPFVVGEPEDETLDGEPGEPDDSGEPDGLGNLELDRAAAKWDAEIAASAGASPAAIAFVGRPNVGKSSLLNALLGEERTIVSEVPGTTRDSIDTWLQWGRSEIVLIDTAGIRRRGKVASGPAAERFSTLRALKAISRADVAVLVIDAVEGLTAQDAHVAGYVVEEGKGLVVAVNKWDLVAEKTDRTFDQYVEWIRGEAPFLDFAPVLSISAKTGLRVGRVLEAAVDIWGERRKRVSTGELNRLVMTSTERTPPPPMKGRRPKLFYATQAAVAPPTFVFFANDAAAVHFSYRRYLENRIREAFGFDGTPVRLVFRDRTAIRLPRRKATRGGAGRRGSKAGPSGPGGGTVQRRSVRPGGAGQSGQSGRGGSSGRGR
jgi:GTP-binding protein